MRRTWLGAVALVAVLAVSAGCGSKSSSKSTKSTTSGVAGASVTVDKNVKGSVTFDGIWTGSEATAFGKVIKAFNQQYPNVKINYKPVGNNVPTVLATAIAGGHPPDMADIAQPGLVKQLAQQGHLKPITYAKSVISANFAPAWSKLGTFNGKLYALVLKASNKSLLWYNVPAYKAAGVKAPKTWSQLLSDAKTLKASGTPAYSIGGADGWTLTDLFENIYLRTYGPAKYDALTAHKIKWTDSSVTKALKTMAGILGDSSNLAGGTSGALQYNFNDSVTNAFSSPPKAATAWAKLGGVGTGNKHVSASIYPDKITRATETPLGTAKSVVFDMSDEQPASFGATTGQGEWGIFQTFLKNPSNVSGIQKQLEAAAAAAYKKGK